MGHLAGPRTGWYSFHRNVRDGRRAPAPALWFHTHSSVRRRGVFEEPLQNRQGIGLVSLELHDSVSRLYVVWSVLEEDALALARSLR